jgi:SAM-dependent methyltransferase
MNIEVRCLSHRHRPKDPPWVAPEHLASYLPCLANSTPQQRREQGVPASRRFFRRVKGWLLRPDAAYRFYLKMKFGAGSLSQPPRPHIANGTLKTRAQWASALADGKALHVPLHRGLEKNWDHLAAVSTILANTDRSARILDAGAEIYSNVLPALFLYGYRDLYGINLDFTEPARRGPIHYLPGDLTRTPFADQSFDAICCLSVIEHGVPLPDYFREMYRLLKPQGVLITSTDYYPTPIDTRGKFAHGTPVRIFSKPEIEDALRTAQSAGFELTGELDLECEEKPIHWEQVELDYTFILFTLRKPASRHRPYSSTVMP